METPKFKSDEEFIAWALQNISEAIKNLSSRIEALEGAIGKMPPPGADMIKYKVPGDDSYSNLKELFDNLYKRINTLENNNKT